MTDCSDNYVLCEKCEKRKAELVVFPVIAVYETDDEGEIGELLHTQALTPNDDEYLCRSCYKGTKRISV